MALLAAPCEMQLPRRKQPMAYEWRIQPVFTARPARSRHVVCATAAPSAFMEQQTQHSASQPLQPSQHQPLLHLQSYDYKAAIEEVAGASRHMLRDNQGRLSLKNLTREQLDQWCLAVGETSKRAKQIWRWLYADGCWAPSLEHTLGQQNSIASRFVDSAKPAVTCDGGLELQEVVRARDGTRKLVFKLTGGEAAGGTVETVLIPVVRSQGQKGRITLCVSTQVGCAMNCQFCYTGRMGLLGNLTTAQIVEQVVQARRFMAEEQDTTPLTNCVFMGMGEPLHNPEAVADAIEIMSCPLGLHMSHNKVTVSTVGLIPEIRRFAGRTRAQLAVSLHATTDEVRDWVVPINKRYPLAQLMTTLRELYPVVPHNHNHGGDTLPGARQDQEHHSSASLQQADEGLQVLQGTASTMEASSAVSAHTTFATSPQQGAGHAVATAPTSTHLSSPQQGAGSTATSPQQGAGDAPSTTRHQRDWSTGQRRVPRRTGSQGTSTAVGGVQQQAGDAQGQQGPADSNNNRHGTLLIAYTMLREVNDTPEDAHRLLGLLDGIAAKINLIEMNTHEGTQLLPSTPEAVSEFRSILVQGGRVCTVRTSRGDDEMAACGQLGDPGLSWKPAPVLEPPPRFKEILRQQQEELRAAQAQQTVTA